MNSKPRSQATYYIHIDTFWQNSPDRFVGPFDSKAEAQAAIDEAYDALDSNVAAYGMSSNNIKGAVRVHGVLSKSAARRAGMRDYGLGDDTSNVIGERVPHSMNDLKEIEEELARYAY
jgi:hypothetical protein